MLGIARAVIGVVDGVVDKIWPDAEATEERKQEKMRLKMELREALLNNQHELRKAAADIVKTEVTGTGLKTWWRPLTMLTFLAMLVAWWFGFTPERADGDLMGRLFDIIEIGLGGYTIGRSAEKIAPIVADGLKNRNK